MNNECYISRLKYLDQSHGNQEMKLTEPKRKPGHIHMPFSHLCLTHNIQNLTIFLHIEQPVKINAFFPLCNPAVLTIIQCKKTLKTEICATASADGR